MNEVTEPEVLKIGKLVLIKNALIYDNSIVQISNICSVWVADQSYVVQHKLPMWVKTMALLGGAAVLLGWNGSSWSMITVGVGLLAGAMVGYRRHKPTTPIAKFALGVERSSGRVKLFSVSDRDFVQRSAQALMHAIAEGGARSEKIVINFDNKQINIENAIGSNVIGGDVSNSLVESLR